MFGYLMCDCVDKTNLSPPPPSTHLHIAVAYRLRHRIFLISSLSCREVEAWSYVIPLFMALRILRWRSLQVNKTQFFCTAHIEGPVFVDEIDTSHCFGRMYSNLGVMYYKNEHKEWHWATKPHTVCILHVAFAVIMWDNVAGSVILVGGGKVCYGWLQSCRHPERQQRYATFCSRREHLVLVSKEYIGKPFS